MSHKFSLHRAAIKILSGFVLLFGSATFVNAQGQIPSGTISNSGSGPFVYNLMFSDAAGASSSIGSVWYSWVPGEFYLPGTPTSASAPSGWTATVFANSVQFVASAPLYDIGPGQSLSGFSYQAAFTPAQLAAAPNSAVSVAYSGGLFSDPGSTFSVQSAAVPEPSAAMLLFLGAGTFWLWRRGKLLRVSSAG